MKTSTWAVCAVSMAAVAVGLASPASADPLEGTYTKVTTGPSGQGLTNTVVFTSCGPDCARDDTHEYHLQGDNWAYSSMDAGTPCGESFNAVTLAGAYNCGPYAFQVQYTKAS